MLCRLLLIRSLAVSSFQTATTTASPKIQDKIVSASTPNVRTEKVYMIMLKKIQLGTETAAVKGEGCLAKLVNWKPGLFLSYFRSPLSIHLKIQSGTDTTAAKVEVRPAKVVVIQKKPGLFFPSYFQSLLSTQLWTETAAAKVENKQPVLFPSNLQSLISLVDVFLLASHNPQQCSLHTPLPLSRMGWEVALWDPTPCGFLLELCRERGNQPHFSASRTRSDESPCIPIESPAATLQSYRHRSSGLTVATCSTLGPCILPCQPRVTRGELLLLVEDPSRKVRNQIPWRSMRRLAICWRT